MKSDTRLTIPIKTKHESTILN